MVYALPNLLAVFAHRSDCPAIPPPPAARGGGIPRDIVECEGSYTKRGSTFSENDPTDPDRGICPKCGRSLKWHRHPSHYYAPWSLPRHNG